LTRIQNVHRIHRQKNRAPTQVREREMAAPWTDVIHQRLLKVHVRWELADAASYLANLMLVTDGMAARAQIKGVFAMITRVADELNPAELLTLRGDAVDPAALHRAHP
jgi:hypothetical protein